MELTKFLYTALLLTLSYNLYGMEQNHKERLFRQIIEAKKLMLFLSAKSTHDERQLIIHIKLKEIENELEEFDEIIKNSEEGQPTCVIRDGAIVAGNDFINYLAFYVYYKRQEKEKLEQELKELKTEIYKKCTLYHMGQNGSK